MNTARWSGLIALALAWGCAGDMAPAPGVDAPGITPLDGSLTPPAALDSGVEAAPVPPDTGPVGPAPDVLPQGGPGEPCPCPAHLRCVEGTCREKCDRQGACEASSSCPAGFGCVSACADTDVCLPAVAAGQPCGNGVYCENLHMCTGHNGSATRCVPVCSNIGGACGNSGGTCAQTSIANCAVCTSP